jgi:hypothetical protein
VRSLRLSSAALAALVAAAVAASPAGAVIVPARSVAGVYVGETEKQVLRDLGTPSGRAEVDSDSEKLTWRNRRLTVLVVSGKVWSVRTKARGERTSNGVGRGTSVTTLKAALAGERCSSTICSVFKSNRVTLYWLKRGKVVAVEVSRVNQAVPFEGERRRAGR